METTKAYTIYTIQYTKDTLEAFNTLEGAMKALPDKVNEYPSFDWFIAKTTEYYTDGISPDKSVVEVIKSTNNYTLDDNRVHTIKNKVEVEE